MEIAGGEGEPAKEDALARLMAIAGKTTFSSSTQIETFFWQKF